MGQAWYLSVDMQLFIISPLILIPLKKHTKPTLIGTGILALASISAGFAMSWIDELRSTIDADNP